MISADQIERFADLPLPVESEVGRCMLPVREVLALKAGSVVKLSSPAGSAVDVFVGGARFGSGELVQMGSAPAVRMLTFARKKGN